MIDCEGAEKDGRSSLRTEGKTGSYHPHISDVRLSLSEHLIQRSAKAGREYGVKEDGVMNSAQGVSYRACAVLFCIACALIPAGCKRTDITLVKKSTYGGMEKTIGMMFDTCSHFVSISWDRIQFEANRPIVVFTAEIPLQTLLNTVSEDAGNWLSIEREYFIQVCGHLSGAYFRIMFPIAQDRTFRLGEVMLGLASADRTVWSPGLSTEEKERVMNDIYEDSPGIFTHMARYANPSFPEGSALFRTLTGKGFSYLK